MHSFRGLATSCKRRLRRGTRYLRSTDCNTWVFLPPIPAVLATTDLRLALMRCSTALTRLSMSSLVCYNGRLCSTRWAREIRETGARGGSSQTRRAVAEINVVPYIDVMFLLVIFMATAPLLMQGVEVDLPKANSRLSLTVMQNLSSFPHAAKLYLNLGASDDQA